MKPILLPLLESAIKQSAAAVISHQESINAINYFPVSDKDTGSNLSMTFEDLLCIDSDDCTISSFMTKVSEVVFDNARGNSGIILSMWFTGLAQSKMSDMSLSLDALKKILLNGSSYLFNNFTDISQGTMITFLIDFTNSIHKISDINFINDQLEYHLQATKEANPTLKKNNVIDAGALGMKIFLESFFGIVFKGKVIQYRSIEGQQSTPSLILNDDSGHEINTIPSYRYCTETIICQPKVNQHELKQILNEFGDCNITLHQKNRIRLHTHTNKPQALFKELYNIGQIKQPKVEDMLRQYQASTNSSEIALVTDSSADLGQEINDKYQIHTIPLLLSFDEQQGLDGYTVAPQDFYQQLADFDVYPMTSAPNQKFCKNLLKFLAKHYKQVLVITISSKMSSTFSNLVSLSSLYKNIHIFDSKKNSGSHGWLVTKAAKLIESGLTLDKIISSLNAYRVNTSTYVYLDNVKAMITSGRVSKLKGFMASFLNLKPIASVDNQGKGIILSKAFSKKSAFRSLISLSVKMHNKIPFKRYCILHVNDEKKATLLADKINAAIGIKAHFIKSVSVVVGIHAGQGALAISFDQGV